MFNRIQLEDDDDEDYDLSSRRRSRSASYFRAAAPRKSISEGFNPQRRKKSTVSQYSQFSDDRGRQILAVTNEMNI